MVLATGSTLHSLPHEDILRELSGDVMLVIEVAAALIRDAAGRYLITQRRSGSHLEGLWEFPGGKREPHESFEQCLRRELTEELAATFRVGKLVRPYAGSTPTAGSFSISTSATSNPGRSSRARP